MDKFMYLSGIYVLLTDPCIFEKSKHSLKNYVLSMNLCIDNEFMYCQ